MPTIETPEYPGKDLEAMSFAKNYHCWILKVFEPYLGGSVAEIGAGCGNFARLVLEKNIKNLKAFEPSGNMFPQLELTLKHDLRAEAINAFFDASYPGTFDSILYVNVLEHIEDDVAELANALESLKPGGYLLVFVPALSWLYSEQDKELGHFRRYTKTGLVELAKQVGFTITLARYFDLAGIVPWYLNFVLLKNQWHSGSVALYDNMVVPIMRKIESLVAPPIGKNVILVAKRLNM